MAEQLILPRRILDANGDPISGAQLYAYLEGTTTLETVYTDEGLTTAHPSPLVADAGGNFAPIWHAGDHGVKVRIDDASDVELSWSPLDPAPMTSSVQNTTSQGLGSITLLTTGSGTYVPPVGCRAIEVEGCAAGGAGGSCNGQGSGTCASAGSGCAGGEFYKFIDSPSASYDYEIGVAGVPGAVGNNPGGDGGDTTFTDSGDTDITAPGGPGGTGNTGTSGSTGGIATSDPTAPTGGDLNTTGAKSPRSRTVSGDPVVYPQGASGNYGRGGVNDAASADGVDATGHGAGGSGAQAHDQSNSRPGGAGSGGFIRIREHF